jgi:succinate dehydrogenase hydrophobic anchor subunit
MTDKESRSVRVGCGRYDWTFQRAPVVLATRLIITIEAMVALDRSLAAAVLDWLNKLEYPWTSAVDVIRTLPQGDLDAISGYVRRGQKDSAVGPK